MNMSILILCGMSASGKDTIFHKLLDAGFNPVIITTTRPMRVGEKQDVDYHFETTDNFLKMLQDGEFLETRQFNTLVDGAEDIWYYGTKLSEFKNGERNMIILDLNGARKVIDYFGKENCCVVYINANDEIRLLRAKRRKSFDQTEWDRRFLTDKEDFSADKVEAIANTVICNNSDNIDSAVENVENYFRQWFAYKNRYTVFGGFI